MVEYTTNHVSPPGRVGSAYVQISVIEITAFSVTVSTLTMLIDENLLDKVLHREVLLLNHS